MATVFPVGQSAPLYTIGSTITVIVMMMLAQLAFTARTDETKSVGARAENPYKWAAWRTFAFVGLAYGFCIWWWVDTAGPWNFKVVWVTSSVVIASAPILAELPLYLKWDEEFFRVHLGAGVYVDLDSAKAIEAAKNRMKITYRGFLYAVHYISLSVLILMSILCLYIFPEQIYSSSNPENIPRPVIVATGVAIFVVLMVDMGVKSFDQLKVAEKPLSSQSTDGTSGLTTFTAGLIDTMVANKRAQVVDLKSLQVNTPPGKFANAAPISFARTQGLAYPRDAPENMLAHKIENQLIRPDTKTTLGIKDYQIIQTNPAQAIIVSSKDGDALMNVVPGGTLNFERHGFLGPVNQGDDDENLNVGTDSIQKVMDKEGERVKDPPHTNRFFFRIFDHEPPILAFQNYVMGIGKGNGLWINTPGMLPMFLSLYFVAIELQIWRNEGAGLMAAFITLAPCFCFAYMGHERQYLQLFWLNRLLGYFVIVTQRSFPYENGTYTSAYLMNSTVIGAGNTTLWVYNSTLTSPNQVVAVQFTTWLAFAYVCLWIIFFVFKCGYVKPNGEERKSAKSS